MPTLQLPAYTPALYLPGHYGRYRSYPFDTTTPIPGAGYDARLRWGEQELNLDGAPAGKRFDYGNYRQGGGVPLLGLGGYLGQVSPADAIAQQAAMLPAAILPAGVTPIQPSPSSSLDPVRRFIGVAEYLWSAPQPDVRYIGLPTTNPTQGGTALPGTMSATWTDRAPLNYDALVDYAKITAIGTFVGVPVALLLGYMLAPKRSVANGRRRTRRRR